MKGFEFSDGLFNLPYGHAIKICRLMKEKNIDMPWRCMLNPSTITRELVQLMKETGCHSVEFGSDSGSNKILKILNKNYLKADIRKAHNIVIEYGIQPMYCVFLGSPGETIETINETFDLMEELAPQESENTVQVFFNLGFRIFDQTKLYEIALKEKVILKKDNMAVPRYYVEPSLLNNEEAIDLIQRRLKNHKNWYLWWGLDKIRLLDRIKQVKEEFRKIEDLFNMAMEE